jgi:hypothetical protein
MDEIFNRILDKLTGADIWIALGFLALGITLWLYIGTTKKAEQKVLRRQIGASLVLLLLAGAGLAINHIFFIREPVFSKGLTGILVMRIVGDDALDSLHGDLIEHLNAELQNDPAGVQIEVHAGTESIDDGHGLADAHKRARAIGQRANAQLVIWGRKIGDKLYFPRITIVAAPKKWRAATERTRDVQDITELRLPLEVTDEPLYLIDFAAGYSYYDRSDYKEALAYFDAEALHPTNSPTCSSSPATVISRSESGMRRWPANLRKPLNFTNQHGMYTRKQTRYGGLGPKTTSELRIRNRPVVIAPGTCKRPSMPFKRLCA